MNDEALYLAHSHSYREKCKCGRLVRILPLGIQSATKTKPPYSATVIIKALGFEKFKKPNRRNRLLLTDEDTAATDRHSTTSPYTRKESALSVPIH
jgi:hypothetical protein